MRRVQQLHLWLGTLFAPLIVFFALTGALQTFNLHEKPGAPNWLARLAQVHKNQNLAVQQRREKPSATPQQARPQPEAERSAGPSPLPLKIFVVLMSLGLTVTTGVWACGWRSNTRRAEPWLWGLLIVGTLLPIALLWV